MATDQELVSRDAFMPNDFTVEDIGRRDRRGRFYYDCGVVRGDQRFLVSNRYGSWIVFHADSMSEPEAVFGPEMGRRVKFVLSQRCASVEAKINDAMGKVKRR